MHVDWDFLTKLSTVISIFTFFPLIFGATRWVIKHLGSSSVARLIAWAVTGYADEQILASTVTNVARLLFAAIVWAFIGAIIGPGVSIALTLFALGMGSQVSNPMTSIVQYATLGALCGAIFRVLFWPLFSGVSRYAVSQRNELAQRQEAFRTQKRRVEEDLQRKRNRP